MAQWKVLRGIHADSKNMKLVRARPSEIKRPDGSVDRLGVERKPDDGVFYAGDIIETDVDLSRVGGLHPGPKFERVESSIAMGEPPSDGLDSMTIAELKQYAEAEEIDLGDATKRAEILALCRGEVSLA